MFSTSISFSMLLVNNFNAESIFRFATCNLIFLDISPVDYGLLVVFTLRSGIIFGN